MDSNSKHLKSLRAHNEQLSGFIVRLSNHYEGLSADIDNELKVLRSHLSGKIDHSLANVSINKVNQLLMLEPISVKTLTQQFVKNLEADIKEFQSLISVPAWKKRAAKIGLQLNRPVPYIADIMPLYEKVLNCYKTGLSEQPPEQSGSDVVAIQSSTSTALKQNIIDELAQLIQSYARINPEDTQISLLQKRISESLTEEELLHSCLILIRVMVQETLTEANTAGQVVQRLNRSLNSIGGDMQSSIHKSVEGFGARQERHQKLMTAIEGMEDAFEGDKTVEQLKSNAEHHLSRLSASLTEGESADRLEQEGLMSLLLSMQQQMSTLQKQTDSYRKKLVEQRVNMYTDALTKVPNRMAYNERAQKEWSKCQQQRRALSVAVVDVDHFKRINDRYGHAAGDKTLQAIARYLKTNIGSNEFLARWGGEEFIILLPDYEVNQLEERLDELRVGLAQLPFKFKQERLTITVSIGSAECGQGEPLEECFERADKCLYQAKSAGRNRVVIQE